MTTTADESGGPAARDRGDVIGAGGKWLAHWGLRLVLIAAGGWVIWLVLSKLWVIVMPVLFAVVLAIENTSQYFRRKLS